MVNTERVVDFYTDCFGNEIDVYEQIENFTVFYEGKIFVDDSDGYNEHGHDSFADAMWFYEVYGDMIHIRDNRCGGIYEYGEWYY